MIKNLNQAHQIQKRRVNLNKHGFAKAVRRFIKQTDPQNYKNVIKKLPYIPIKIKQVKN